MGVGTLLTASPVIDLSGDPVRQRREAFVRSIFMAAAVFSVAISVAIVVSLFGEAGSFLDKIDFSQFFTNGWFPRRGRFQVMALVAHSAIITGVAITLAVPLGLGSAIYLSEYAKSGTRRLLKPMLEVLAGIPSVVLGVFALNFITPQLVKRLFSTAETSNLLAAGLGVGILIVPLVASISEDAMRAVPDSLRQAAYGLGAKPWHVSLRVVVPAALSGIAAAIILAISRAIGETMVVALAAGNAGILTANPLEGGITLTGAIAALAIGSDQVAGDNAAFQSLFFVGLLLFVMTFVLNIISERVVRRYRQRY